MNIRPDVKAAVDFATKLAPWAPVSGVKSFPIAVMTTSPRWSAL